MMKVAFLVSKKFGQNSPTNNCYLLKIVFAPKALKTLRGIGDFVESINTPGSGARYVNRFIDAIEKHAQPDLTYKLCNNLELARLKYSCTFYNNWVITFRVTGDKFTVYRIIHSSILK